MYSSIKRVYLSTYCIDFRVICTHACTTAYLLLRRLFYGGGDALDKDFKCLLKLG